MFFGRRFGTHHKGSLTGLEILVLSIIKNNESISGYEIIKKINKKYHDLWKASAGTIYPLLNRLLERSLIEMHEDITENRLKKLYKITEVGKEALRKVLEHDFKPSISTFGDVIRTIFKAIPIQETLEEAFCGFPFYESHEEKIDQSDLSQNNIKKVKMIIERLIQVRDSLEGRIDHIKTKIENINKKIGEHESTLNKIITERKNKAKIIEIEEETEKF